MTNLRLLIGTLLVLSASASSYAASSARPRINFDYLSVYESNIYHSHYDSQRIGSQVNDINADARWMFRSPARLRHEALLYADVNLYLNHSSRNKSSFGARYEPAYWYARFGKIRGLIDVSRRNKDLLNDAGEVLDRTLMKNVLTAGVEHSIRWRRLRAAQLFTYDKDNYDETYVAGVRQLSYDYHASYWEADMRYEIHRLLVPRLILSTERRYYDERRTLAIDKKSSQVRNDRTTSVDFQFASEPADWLAIELQAAWERRKENYENFYGYTARDYGFSLEITPAQRHLTELSFEFKNKDYPNYWTSDIGLLHRVSIDYATFRFRYTYQFHEQVAMRFYLRNFNKVSNDIKYDYNYTYAGLGIVVSMR